MTTILIVEDDQLLLQTVSNMLKHEGFEVISAKNMDSAFNYLQDGCSINLILLDIWLEGRPSYQVIDLAAKTHASTPIIVMSGGGGSMSIEIASSLARMKGISSFIQKPVVRPALVELIRQALSGSSTSVD